MRRNTIASAACGIVTSVAMGLTALTTTGASAQCVPLEPVFQTGPGGENYTNPLWGYFDLISVQHPEGSTLYASGLFGSRSSSPAVADPRYFVTQFRNGRWTPLRGNPPLPNVTIVRRLLWADMSAVGGPGPSLYVAGGIYQNGLQTVVRWDDATGWQPVGGTTAPPTDPRGLVQFDDGTGTALYVGGTGGTVARWQGGAAWEAIGAPLNTVPSTYPVVNELKVMGVASAPRLYAAGKLSMAAGPRAVAVWNGTTWEPISTPAFVGAPEVNSMAIFDDGTGPALYIVGNPMQLGPTGETNAARLRNGDWEGLPSVNRGSNFPPRLTVVGEGADQRLYLSGVNLPASEGKAGTGVLRWTAAGWVAEVSTRSFAGALTPGSVAAVVEHDDGAGKGTYFAGQFRSVGPSPSTSPTKALPAESLALSRGGAVEVVQRGLGNVNLADPYPYQTRPYQLQVIDLGQGPRLMTVGSFSRAGGLYSPGAAMYDGERFTPMPTADVFVQAPGVATIDGVRRPVGALGPDGTLMSFWNGSEWKVLGSYPGSAPRFSIEFNGALYVMGVSGIHKFQDGEWTREPDVNGRSAVVADLGDGERMYVAGQKGSFYGILAFDGTDWTPVSTSLSAFPDRIIVHDDGAGPKLYVTEARIGGLPFNRVMQWDGDAWRQLGTGMTGPATFDIAIASYDDGTGPALYALGGFTIVGSPNIERFARWRNGVWESPVRLTSPYEIFQGYAMTVFKNKLYIAGASRTFGGQPADNLIVYGRCENVCRADFDGDGDVATDADIEAFFACLAGNCCATCGTADFNNDGDDGTAADIESFFRVLAGGAC